MGGFFMLEKAKNYHRIYYKNYGVSIEDMYCFEYEIESDEELPSVEFVSKGKNGILNGYITFYVDEVAKEIYQMEVIAEYPNKEFFTDLRDSIRDFIQRGYKFEIVVEKKAPSYKMCQKLFNEFDGKELDYEEGDALFVRG